MITTQIFWFLFCYCFSLISITMQPSLLPTHTPRKEAEITVSSISFSLTEPDMMYIYKNKKTVHPVSFFLFFLHWNILLAPLSPSYVTQNFQVSARDGTTALPIADQCSKSEPWNQEPFVVTIQHISWHFAAAQPIIKCNCPDHMQWSHALRRARAS